MLDGVDGYLHNLSKRTGIYRNVARVNNKGASAIAVDKNPTLMALPLQEARARCGLLPKGLKFPRVA